MDETNMISREGVTDHEKPDVMNWRKGRKGVTAGEEEEEEDVKSKTDQQEKGTEDSSEEDATKVYVLDVTNEGDGDDQEYPSYYGQYQGLII